jgi:Protein of unknown function (DUF2971)
MPEMHESERDGFDAWLEETYRLRGVTDRLPSRLYKFMTPKSEYFEKNLAKLILDSQVRLACRLKFNDPFDTRVALDVPDSSDALSKFVAGFAARNPGVIAGDVEQHFGGVSDFRTRAKDGFDRVLDSLGIFSLCETVNHPLMWAHYATSHQGIALSFRHAVDGEFGAYPIRYQSEYPRVSIDTSGIDIYQAFVKGPEWAYEKEWRLVEHDKARQWFDLPKPTFNGVVFGVLCKLDTISSVLDLIRMRCRARFAPHTCV